MKKTSLIIMAAIAVLSSCNKDIISQEAEQLIPTGKATISLNLSSEGNALTRSLSAFDEQKISSLLVCFFRKDKSLDVIHEFKDVLPKTELQVKCEAGPNRSIYAIANWMPETPIKNESDLLQRITQLTDNSAKKIVMTGGLKNQTITNGQKFNVRLRRTIAKVTIANIANALEPMNLKGKDLVIKSISLINVPITSPLFPSEWASNGKPYGPTEPTAWCNKMKYENDPSTRIYTHDDINETIHAGESHSKLHTFYMCANHFTDNGTPDPVKWSPRQTKLVVEASIDSSIYYYSVILKSVEANFHHNIKNLIITRKGSTQPDIPVENTIVNPSVEIEPWGEHNYGEIRI